MYRRRRLTVLGGVLLLVLGVVLAIWQPWNAAGSTPGPSSPPAASADATLPASPDATPDATPAVTDAADGADPAPSPDPSGTDAPIAACSTANIAVLAVTDKESYGSGELPQLSISLSNTSDTPCLINVGTATQAFVISSGSDIWWRSTDCQTESSDQVVQLAAGQTVASVTPLVWDRTRSATDSCADARPQAPSGYFHLAVSIGGIQSADTAMFQLR